MTNEIDILRQQLAASAKQYQEARDDAHRFAAENEQLRARVKQLEGSLLNAISIDGQAQELSKENEQLRQQLAEAQTRELNKDFEYKRFRDFIADQSAYIGCAIMPAELYGDVDLLDWIDDQIAKG